MALRLPSHRVERLGCIARRRLQGATGQTNGHGLASLDEAAGSDDILRPPPVLLHVKLTVDDVLVIHGELELEHLAVADESAVAQIAVRG